MKEEEIKKIVRDGYAKVVQSGSSCCGSSSTCCGSSESEIIKDISKNIGYSEEELLGAPITKVFPRPDLNVINLTDRFIL